MEAGRYDLKFQDFNFDKRKSAHLLNTNKMFHLSCIYWQAKKYR